MPTEPAYPRFFATPVGLSPGKMKTLYSTDLAALCAAFSTLTGIDPLGPGVDVSLLWEDWKRIQAGISKE